MNQLIPRDSCPNKNHLVNEQLLKNFLNIIYRGAGLISIDILSIKSRQRFPFGHQETSFKNPAKDSTSVQKWNLSDPESPKGFNILWGK